LTFVHHQLIGDFPPISHNANITASLSVIAVALHAAVLGWRSCLCRHGLGVLFCDNANITASLSVIAVAMHAAVLGWRSCLVLFCDM